MDARAFLSHSLEVPELTAIRADGRAVTSQAIHLGVAIALRQGGLVAPALHDTDRQSLEGVPDACPTVSQPTERHDR